DGRDRFDDAAEQAKSQAEYSEALDQGAEARARLVELLEIVRRELVEAGVVRPARLRLIPVAGWRVLEWPGGRRTLTVVTRAYTGDKTLYRGEGAYEAACEV